MHDGIWALQRWWNWALPDGIGLCLLAIVPANAGPRAGHGGTGGRPCGGIVRIYDGPPSRPGGRRWPLEGGPASAGRPWAAGCRTE